MRLEYYKDRIDMGIDWGFAYQIYNMMCIQYLCHYTKQSNLTHHWIQWVLQLKYLMPTQSAHCMRHLACSPIWLFAVQHLSQFIISYGAEHWTTIKHVLRYLKGSSDDGITFTWDASLNLKIFIDSDYANRMDTLSINGYVAILGGGSVTWSSKKQWMIALSTMEAKYMALTKGTKQLIWFI